MPDSEYLAWLQSPSAIRCLLVEVAVSVSGVETVRYLSTLNYITDSAATPPNTAYMAVIGGGVTISEKLSIDGSASLSFGDIEIDNTEGVRDSWLDDVWTNRSVNVFCGDVRWQRSQFRQVFSGTLAGISSRDRNTLNLALRDKLQRLNTPMSEAKLGGTTDNKDLLQPLCFGECHNIEPLLVDPATLTYQVHSGPIERIIEVRDNGVPVSATIDLGLGTFTLTAQPAGMITCSVQGDKFGGVYRNTVGALVQRICTGYGKVSDRFGDSDIDDSNFAEFESGHSQPVGIYIQDRTNVLEVCAELASSLGAQLVMSRVGKLRLLKVSLPTGTPDTATPEHMDMQSLHVADRPAVQASVKIGYCKNWTVQTELQTGIPEAHKNLFALEWLTSTAVDTAVASLHRLSAEPVQIDTLLLVEADADAEAARRLTLWSTQRNVYGYSGTPSQMLTELGTAKTLTHQRYGLASGGLGQVVGIDRDWLSYRTQFEVLI